MQTPEWISHIQSKEVYVYGLGKKSDLIIEQLEKHGIHINKILCSHIEKENITNEKYDVIEYRSDLIKTGSVIIVAFDISKNEILVDKLTGDRSIDEVVVFFGTELFWKKYMLHEEISIKPKIYIVDNYYIGSEKRGLTKEYVDENKELFEQTRNWLEDNQSREIFDKYIKGHTELLNFPFKDYWKPADIHTQYFPQRYIELGEEEVFVDCGAYTGDTLVEFKKQTLNHFKRYYAFEPDGRRFEELERMIHKDERIKLIKKAAWESEDKLMFSMENDCGEIVAGEGYHIDAGSIDESIDENMDVTFIKMDIEGAELMALKGAKNTIQKYHPKLAICVYHKKEDLITIPQFIKGLDSKYKLYLKAHFPYVSETVLYAIYGG